MDPPGRFLRKNYSTYEWEPVSDRVAREKVCQVSLLASKHQDSLNRSYFYNVLYSKSLRDAVAVERDQVGMVFLEVASSMRSSIDNILLRSMFSKRAEAQVPADPLPDVLDVLSSEQLPPLPPTNQVAPNQVVPDSSASSHQPFERPRKPEVRAGGTGRLITPPRLNDVEGDRVDAYYFRSGYSEDFDLFNGQLTEVDWR